MIAGEGLADSVDVELDEMGFTHEQAIRIFEAARSHGMAIRVHTDELSDFNGTATAVRYGARTADHLEYISEEGVAAMAGAGTVAVLLPGTTYTNRATRKPPIELFRAYQVPIAISTNSNPGPSPATSLLMVLNLACTILGITPEEAISGVTRNAAAALGMKDAYGTLESGKVADFVLWDIERPAELAYHIGYNPCVQVIKEGKIVRGNAIL
jgi:imidazolonepropionase